MAIWRVDQEPPATVLAIKPAASPPTFRRAIWISIWEVSGPACIRLASPWAKLKDANPRAGTIMAAKTASPVLARYISKLPLMN
jgi:hypothetical protein